MQLVERLTCRHHVIYRTGMGPFERQEYHNRVAFSDHGFVSTLPTTHRQRSILLSRYELSNAGDNSIGDNRGCRRQSLSADIMPDTKHAELLRG